jgi:hypothetical protein
VSIGAAWVFFALVDVEAFASIAKEAVVAGAFVAAVGICTRWIGVTSVLAITFVDVRADNSVAVVTNVASTVIASVIIDACSECNVANIVSGAFVDVVTNKAISFVSDVAGTLKGALVVSAGAIVAARFSKTLVDIGTVDTVAVKADFTSTVEATVNIGTYAVAVAVVQFIGGTFIDVITVDSIAVIAVITGTTEWTDIVGAGSISVAVVSIIEALIVVGAVDTVAAKSRVTVTVIAAWKIGTGGVVVAVVGAVIAFVDVNADVVFHNKAGVAVAAVWALRVDTETIGDVTWVVAIVGTFIEVAAFFSVADIADVAVTVVVSECVGACAVGRASVQGTIGTFVDVLACDTIAREAVVAAALKASLGVAAWSVGIAVISAVAAFIDIVACNPITNIAAVTSTTEGANSVCACSIGMAVVFADITLVVVCTVAIFRVHSRDADVSSSAFTSETAVVVWADSVGNAIVALESSSTFIDVITFLTSAGVASVACTGPRTISVGASRITITIVGLFGALVDVFTFNACSSVSTVARATKSARLVGTSGVCVAVVKAADAFVFVKADESVGIAGDVVKDGVLEVTVVA